MRQFYSVAGQYMRPVERSQLKETTSAVVEEFLQEKWFSR